MTTNVASESIWAEAVAARLKLIQSDCADSPATTRREYLVEEIERAIKLVPAERRNQYLQALAAEFPAWAEFDPAASSRNTSTTELTPEQLVKLLVQAAPGLTDEARSKLAQMLAPAGLAAAPQVQGQNGVPDELRSKLGLKSEDTLVLANAIQALALLLSEFSRLDALVWETWAKLAPRSPLRRDPHPGTDLKSTLEHFLRGDASTAPAQVQQTLDKSRRLLAGLLAAIPLGGKAFAEEYMVRFLPKNIEDVASSRGGGLFGDSTEKRCWNKYKELAYPDAESVEKKIRDAVAKHAEEMAKKS